MSNHTAGPWRHEQTGPSPNRLDELISSDGQTIAWAYDADDARLIASAPDLLEALTGALKAWDAIYQSSQMKWGGDIEEIEDFEFREMSAARAAIAKATGEKS